MPNAIELVKVIKKAAVEAQYATKPVQVCFGKVTSISPLKIFIDQKLTLGKSQLILTRNVTDFITEISVSWSTENKGGGSGESSFALHDHSISGRKKITVHNGLVVGDDVILLRQQNGQKYIVVDRIG